MLELPSWASTWQEGVSSHTPCFSSPSLSLISFISLTYRINVLESGLSTGGGGACGWSFTQGPGVLELPEGNWRLQLDFVEEENREDHY